jgi:hypothetical protein
MTNIEDGYTVHAEVSLPGLYSKVLSKRDSLGTIHAHHVIRDEFTDSIVEDYPTGDFQVLRREGKTYLSYASQRPADLMSYKQAHNRSIDFWVELYCVNELGQDDALRYAASNRVAYEGA